MAQFPRLLAFSLLAIPVGVLAASDKPVNDGGNPGRERGVGKQAFPVEECATKGRLVTGKDGKTLRLDSLSLARRAVYRAPPKMPAIARQARIEGSAVVGVLVDEGGHIACAWLINGHPMLSDSAISAARKWKFRPMKQDGEPASYYGFLSFHYSTRGPAEGKNPCTEAHW